MIDESRAEKAVEYIRDIADEYAEARSLSKYLDHKRRVIRATEFSEATGTVAEREAIAESSEEYRKCLEDYRDAVYKEAEIATRIKAAELTVELWRSQNKGRSNI